MHQYIKLKQIFLVIVTGMVLNIWPASGYVLQGPHILQLMTGESGRARQLKVTQRLVFYDRELQGGEAVVSEVLRYGFPDLFRSDIKADHIQRIHVVTPGDDMTIVDGRISPESGSWFDSYKDVILYRTRQLLQERLIHHGVDVQVSSLGRFEGEIVFIIGAQYPDETVSQLWLDKETFRPVRLMIVRNVLENSDRILDIRYRQWRQVGKIWYPMQIVFFQNDVMLREIHVDETAVNPGFAGDYFDMAHLRAVYRTEQKVEEVDGEPDEMSEIRKAIEEFKKTYD